MKKRALVVAGIMALTVMASTRVAHAQLAKFAKVQNQAQVASVDSLSPNNR
jgi:hypothetical protein